MDIQKTPSVRQAGLPFLRSGRRRCKEIILMLVSLCLGILIWLLVVGSDQMAMTLTVPLEILNLPKHLVIYNQYQKEVNVTLSGPRSIMQEMRNRPQLLSLPVDLAEAKPDTMVLDTDTLNLPLPGGVSVVRIQPANITLSIDKMVTKRLPIVAETEGKVALGYTVHEITLSPDKIQVPGPQTLLERQQVLKTYLINLEGLNRSATLPVRLALTPELASLIGETTVAAKITVKEKIIEKIIHNIPVGIRGGTKPVTLKPEVVSVFASIPESLLVDSQALPLLFTALVSVSDGELPRSLPVEIAASAVSGHEPILIKSYTPQTVEILPPGSSEADAAHPAPQPDVKEAKKDDRKKKQAHH